MVLRQSLYSAVKWVPRVPVGSERPMYLYTGLMYLNIALMCLNIALMYLN